MRLFCSSGLCLATALSLCQAADSATVHPIHLKQNLSFLQNESPPDSSSYRFSSVFEPHLNEISTLLPAGLAMRLPNSLTFSHHSIENEEVHVVQVSSKSDNSGLSVDIFQCSETNRDCWIGTVSVEQVTLASTDKFEQQRSVGLPIALIPGVVGYFKVGDTLSEDGGPSSVMWRQGNAVYTVLSPIADRQSLLSIVQSMANADPITSAQLVPPLAEIDSHAAIVQGTDIESNEAFSIANTVIAQAADEDTSEGVLEDSGSQENVLEGDDLNEDSLDSDSDELPLFPEGFEFDEAGENFLLSVVRPIPIVEAQIRSSVLTNQSESTVFLNDGSSSNRNIDNTLLVNSAALRISPELGRRARVDGGIRLSHVIPLASTEESESASLTGANYNVFDADLGVRYELDQAMALRLGWKYQKISYGIRFPEVSDYSDHQIRLNLNRFDSLSDRTFLITNYGANVIFANGSFQNRNRWSNTAGVGLAYSLTPKMLGRLGYQLNYTSYFEFEDALSHNVGAQLTYIFDDNLSVGGSVGYRFGEAIDLFSPRSGTVDLNNLSFGVHINVDIPFSY